MRVEDSAIEHIEIKRGTVFAERYEIHSLIGHGPHGSVYRAELLAKEGSYVALKILHECFVREEGIRSRFIEGSTKAASLEPNPLLVKVIEVLESDEQVIVVSELAEGRVPLTDFIGHLDMKSRLVTSFIKQISQGLDLLYKAGLYHKNLKPHNIFIVEGEVKLVDYGISRVFEPTGIVLRDCRSLMPYLAPEIWSMAPANVKSDLYSLGVSLYELLSGSLPYDDNNMDELRLLHLDGSPAPLSESIDGLPEWLDNLTMQLLEKLPQNRPSTPSVIIDLVQNLPKEEEVQEEDSSLPDYEQEDYVSYDPLDYEYEEVSENSATHGIIFTECPTSDEIADREREMEEIRKSKELEKQARLEEEEEEEKHFQQIFFIGIAFIAIALVIGLYFSMNFLLPKAMDGDLNITEKASQLAGTIQDVSQEVERVAATNRGTISFGNGKSDDDANNYTARLASRVEEALHQSSGAPVEPNKTTSSGSLVKKTTIQFEANFDEGKWVPLEDANKSLNDPRVARVVDPDKAISPEVVRFMDSQSDKALLNKTDKIKERIVEVDSTIAAYETQGEEERVSILRDKRMEFEKVEKAISVAKKGEDAAKESVGYWREALKAIEKDDFIPISKRIVGGFGISRTDHKQFKTVWETYVTHYRDFQNNPKAGSVAEDEMLKSYYVLKEATRTVVQRNLNGESDKLMKAAAIRSRLESMQENLNVEIDTMESYDSSGGGFDYNAAIAKLQEERGLLESQLVQMRKVFSEDAEIAAKVTRALDGFFRNYSIYS